MADDQNQQGRPSGDMSQYIRTYAKDVAELTNQPPPPPKPKPADDGVTLPEVDASPVNRPGGTTPDFPQETLAVTKEDSEGIFTKPTAAPLPPPPPPPSGDEMERREEVLARLRAKIGSVPQAAPPAPAPMPEFSPFPPAPPAPVAPPPPPPPAPPPIGIIPTDAPSPLHTYTSDFAGRINQEKASTFSVLAAQSDAGLQTTTTVATKKKGSLVPALIAMLLVVAGAGGLYAAYRYVGFGENETVTLGVPSLIYADEKMELLGPNYRQDLRDAANEPLVEGNILITYVTAASSTLLAPAPQPGGALIRLLNLGAPDILLRNVDITSTVGVVAANDETHPFFVLRVNSYERTFAGMLAWESRMLADLEPLYPPYAELAPVPTSTTTATSTSPTPVRLQPSQGFVDHIVSNVDVRVLRDGFGRSLVLYGYSDKETLIIARDEDAFAALVSRLNATRGEE